MKYNAAGQEIPAWRCASLYQRMGIVTESITEAAKLGARWAGCGYSVSLRLVWAEEPRLEESPPPSADVVIIVAGSPTLADRAQAVLQRWGVLPLREPAGSGQSAPPSLPLGLASGTGILVLVGSAKEAARQQLERLADAGALVLTLSREAVLNQDESMLMGLRSGAAAAIKQGRDVVVRSENWPGAAEVTRKMAAKRLIPAEEVDRRVRTMLARVGEGVVASGATACVIGVGTETAAALCRQLGIEEMRVAGEVVPGLPAVVAEGYGGRSGPLVLALKAGGTGGPETLAEAVAALRLR